MRIVDSMDATRSRCWRRLRGIAVVASLLVVVGCSGPLADASGLRRLPVLDYSVWVTGGAFVRSDASDGRNALDRTFRTPVEGDLDAAVVDERVLEAIPLPWLERFLRRAEVFRRLEVDERDAGPRLVSSRSVSPDLLQQVRDAGHDLVLVVRGVEDGAVEDQGINGRWPVTLLTWVGLGLGMVIPDRTYESRASLQVSLVDPWSGQELLRETLGPGPIELALVDRGSLLGIVMSIVVPPFWVPSNGDRVAARVRDDSARRLAVGIARRLKRSLTVQLVDEGRGIRFAFESGGPGVLRVRCRSREALSFVRARIDGDPVRSDAFDQFERDLLANQRPAEPRPGRSADTGFVAEADWAIGAAWEKVETIQLLVQTVAGRVASTTFTLGGERAP
jgi:hypothetical protein